MTPAQNPTTTQKLDDISVVVIDDDRRIARLIRSVLEGLGFSKVALCHSAEEAKSYLAGHTVDLVLCDWMMDGQSGVSLIQEMRADIAHRNQLVPVIMLSGNAERPLIEAARDCGVTEYVMKPFTAKSLCSRIISVIEKPRSFVISPNFNGHSRRRRTEYIGEDRRKPR